MDIRVTWPNPTHFLLGGARVALRVDGQPVLLTVATGRAEGTVPAGTGSPPIAELEVEFRPSPTGPAATVLLIRQRFELRPPSATLLPPGGPQPTEYVVRPTGLGREVVQAGRHPLIHSEPGALGSLWRVTIDTQIVDATAVQPHLLDILNGVRMPPPTASVRILARTDGKLPLHYVTATPPSCTAAPATDVLGFLTAPQAAGADVDTDEGLILADRIRRLGTGAAEFLGNPRPGDPRPRFQDRFSRPPRSEHPNFVLARRWEAALMASGRHVALVLPVPANHSHNTAGTGELPVQLRQVHSVLVALGDIAAPSGAALGEPLLAAAAHSLGGPFLFQAVQQSAKSAFSELWLFEAVDAEGQVDLLARTVGTRVLFAGYAGASVERAFSVAKSRPRLRDRVRRLPNPPPPTDMQALVRSNASLAHMVEGIFTPPDRWEPRILRLSSGRKFHEHFEALHQLIVQGDDADRVHFLTKALSGSILR